MLISRSERKRLEKMSLHEKRIRENGYRWIAGVDEAGRGPLAGPVVAAACILPECFLLEGLNDSKQVSCKIRLELHEKLKASPGVIFAVSVVDVETIDRINILQASFLAMKQAVACLSTKADFILVDGDKTPFLDIPSEAIVQGDSLSLSIAAASIFAKVTRDRILEECDVKWPEYGFKQHKGYGTEAHLTALQKWGPCPIHRRSFDPVRTLYVDTQTSFL